MPRPCTQPERIGIIVLTSSMMFIGYADADARLSAPTITMYDVCALPRDTIELDRIYIEGMPRDRRPASSPALTVHDIHSLRFDPTAKKANR